MRQCLEEVRDFQRVRGAITFEKKVLRLVGANAYSGVRENLRRPVVTGLQLPFCAEHFEALIVTVRGATAGIDLTQAAGLGANSDCGRVNIPRLTNLLLYQATGAGMHALRLVAQDP